MLVCFFVATKSLKLTDVTYCLLFFFSSFEISLFSNILVGRIMIYQVECLLLFCLVIMSHCLYIVSNVRDFTGDSRKLPITCAIKLLQFTMIDVVTMNTK